jgi:hypothetical protein
MMRAEPQALAETKAFLEALPGVPAGQVRGFTVDTLLRLMEQPQTSIAINSFAEGNSPPWFKKYKPVSSPFWSKNV